jgi:methionyl-tRNA synthetase
MAIASENIRQANAYIEKQRPWELAAANDTDTLADVIYNLLEILRHTAWMILPAMPETADKLLTQLGFDPAKERSKSFAELTKWPVIEKGQKIAKGQPLFPKLNK